MARSRGRDRTGKDLGGGTAAVAATVGLWQGRVVDHLHKPCTLLGQMHPLRCATRMKRTCQ